MSTTLEQDTEGRPDPVRTRARWVLGSWALLAAAGLVTLVCAGWLAVRATGSEPISPYVVQQYWLSYEDGFVRRGLVGAGLRWISGGQPPSYGLVKAAGVGLTVLAIAAIVALAVGLARRTPDRSRAALVAAAVLVSPVAFSHFVRDVGRGDTVGVVVLALLALLPWRRLPVWAVVAGVAVLSALAVAVTEFLLLLVAPLAVAVLWRRVDRPPVGLAASALAPAVALAAVSALVAPSERTLAGALDDAAAAGAPSPVDTPVVDHNSVERLRYGVLDNAGDYYSITDPLTVAVLTLAWAAAFAVTLALVWHLLGGSLRQRSWQLLVAGYAAVALVLSVAGIDFRRWWALAAVAALAMLLFLRPQGAGPWRWRLGVLAAVAALLGFALLDVPLFKPELF